MFALFYNLLQFTSAYVICYFYTWRQFCVINLKTEMRNLPFSDKHLLQGLLHKRCANVPEYSQYFLLTHTTSDRPLCFVYISSQTHTPFHLYYDTPGKHYNSLLISLGPFGQDNT